MDFLSARGAYVVLDATELHRDWLLAGLEFRLLRFLGREAGLNTVIPASVVAEAVANHEREYSRARRDYLKAAQAMRRVAGHTMPTIEIPDAVAYAEILEERLESSYIEVLSLPAVPHEEIVARAVARMAPFDQTGSGYRDTLTWLTCLELAAKGEDVYLVSQDKDFAGPDLSLAPSLQSEVEGLLGNITLIRQLGLWLMPIVPWRNVTDLREAAALARDEEVASIFAPWDRFETVQFDPVELGLPPDAVIHDISYYGSGTGEIERTAHERHPDGSDRVTYTFPIEFEVEVSLTSDDARELGLLHGEGSTMGIEYMTTVVPMIGTMVVVHDERDLESPIYFDDIEFEPERGVYHRTARSDDAEQLRIDLVPRERSSE